MKNWQNKELTQILKEKRAENRMETIGLIITGALLGASVILIAHAYIISLTLQ